MNDMSASLAHSPAASTQPHIAVLGAGPAGLAAAQQLAKRGMATVTVIERATRTGGNASSFMLDGVWCDYGSHRLHPVADPAVLADIRELLGTDLLLRPRHGRIRLQGRWINFPLKPANLLRLLPTPFTVSLLFDGLMSVFRGNAANGKTFADVLRAGIGPTISEAFYFPYVKKLWGLDPELISPKLAERRVSGNSVVKILAKMFSQLPGLRSNIAGQFYYPRRGFGRITKALHHAAERDGAKLRLATSITAIERSDNQIVALRFERAGQVERIVVDRVFSTIPITSLVRLIEPPAPPNVRAAADQIQFRGMILIYLVIEQDRFTEYDAHYFPEARIPISRLSEPKNYSDTSEPHGVTVLCAELPCDPTEPAWSMDDDALGVALAGWLAEVGLPIIVPIRSTITVRLPHAYPVYDLGYQARLHTLDTWLSELEGLLTFGRQGLFAHDNTHHAMAMAYAAVDCLDPDGGFDHAAWARCRERFETHVVED